MSRQRLIWVTVVALLLAGCGWSLTRHRGIGRGEYGGLSTVAVGLTTFPPGTRPQAPVVSGTSLMGAAYASSAAAGHVLVVNIWGSWCGPCRAETPELVRVANEFRARGVQFLGVDTRDNLGAGRAFVRRFQVPYPSLVDDGSVSLQLRGMIPTAVVPSTIVIDSDGRLTARVIGRVTYDTLKGLLRDELARIAPSGNTP